MQVLCFMQVADCFYCIGTLETDYIYGCSACLNPQTPEAISRVCLPCPLPASTLTTNVVWACGGICANTSFGPTGEMAWAAAVSL